MRYDTPVLFISEGEEVYDPSTSDYNDTVTTETQLWANVSDTGEERQSLLYGAVNQGALTVRLQNKPPKFDRLKIRDKEYVVRLRKNFRRETVLHVNSV